MGTLFFVILVKDMYTVPVKQMKGLHVCTVVSKELWGYGGGEVKHTGLVSISTLQVVGRKQVEVLSMQ